MKVKAYAKLNLALKVECLREDKMHELRMIMQEVDLCDEIEINPSDKTKVTIEGIDSVNNTVYKSAIAFFSHTSIIGGADIYVKKQIPAEAGLGGGSADAAAVLKALNKMHGHPLCTDELISIGNTIGADVPFCIVGGCCIARGTGDKLVAIENNLDVFYLIAKPDAGVSTAQAFKLFDETGHGAQGDFDACKEAIISGNLAEFCPVNDLQEVAQTLCPEINTLLKKLNEHTETAFMTGSGSACVGIFEDEETAKACRHSLNCFTAVVRGRQAGDE